MLALIDNYTTIEPSSSPYAYWYKTDWEPISSGIIVGQARHYGINKRIHKLLSEYSQLKNNWDQDEAVAPNETTIVQARFITTLLERHGQAIFHVAPGPNGEVMLDIRNSKKNRSLELIFYPTRSVIVTFPEDQNPVQKIFELSDLPAYLEWLNSK